MSDKRIRVLVVDDSPTMRQIISTVLAQDPQIDVVGTAPDPLVAREKIKSLEPDVLTLDVEMPNMHGLDFLERLMTLRPMPVVMVSTLTQKGAETSLEALEIGAFDVVGKPASLDGEGIARLATDLIPRVKAAASARLSPRQRRPAAQKPPIEKAPASFASWTGTVVAIGSSTGGVDALRQILTELPPTVPPILVTQHMPPNFTASFAARLDRDCALTVREATDRLPLARGHVFIAPGDRHLELVRTAAGYQCRVSDGPAVSGHRPSVDVLFRSVATEAKSVLGIILTGMGKDGARGLRLLRDAGADTIGQSEASCVVYGMPKAAMALGATQVELPPARIAQRIAGL